MNITKALASAFALLVPLGPAGCANHNPMAPHIYVVPYTYGPQYAPVTWGYRPSAPWPAQRLVWGTQVLPTAPLRVNGNVRIMQIAPSPRLNYPPATQIRSTAVVGTRHSPGAHPFATEDRWIYDQPRSDETKPQALKIAALGIVFFREGNYLRAHVYLKRALELLPEHQCILTYYAACLANLGQREEAKAEFQKAIGLDPSSLDAEQARKWINQVGR